MVSVRGGRAVSPGCDGGVGEAMIVMLVVLVLDLVVVVVVRVIV
jgi:hypothetical protein